MHTDWGFRSVARALFCLTVANATPEPAHAQDRSGGARWLDEPLTAWNAPGVPVPAPPVHAPRDRASVARCRYTTPDTPAARELAAAGWIPFLHLDRELVSGDTEILGGMTAAGADCGPAVFNLFVFVSGTYAGTMSPVVMTHQRDGAAGAVRLLPDLAASAEYARYTSTDTPCCPSGRVTVRFRVSRDGALPVLLPVDVRTTR